MSVPAPTYAGKAKLDQIASDARWWTGFLADRPPEPRDFSRQKIKISKIRFAINRRCSWGFWDARGHPRATRRARAAQFKALIVPESSDTTVTCKSKYVCSYCVRQYGVRWELGTTTKFALRRLTVNEPTSNVQRPTTNVGTWQAEAAAN